MIVQNTFRHWFINFLVFSKYEKFLNTYVTARVTCYNLINRNIGIDLIHRKYLFIYQTKSVCCCSCALSQTKQKKVYFSLNTFPALTGSEIPNEQTIWGARSCQETASSLNFYLNLIDELLPITNSNNNSDRTDFK